MAEQIRSAQAMSGRHITSAMADNPKLLQSLTDAELDMLITMVETEEVEDKKNLGDYAAQGLDMYGDFVNATSGAGGTIAGGIAGAASGPLAPLGVPTAAAAGGIAGQGIGTAIKSGTSAITKGVHEDRLKRVGGGQRTKFERLARIKAVKNQRLKTENDREKLRKGYAELAGNL